MGLNSRYRLSRLIMAFVMALVAVGAIMGILRPPSHPHKFALYGFYVALACLALMLTCTFVYQMYKGDGEPWVINDRGRVFVDDGGGGGGSAACGGGVTVYVVPRERPESALPTYEEALQLATEGKKRKGHEKQDSWASTLSAGSNSSSSTSRGLQESPPPSFSAAEYL